MSSFTLLDLETAESSERAKEIYIEMLKEIAMRENPHLVEQMESVMNHLESEGGDE